MNQKFSLLILIFTGLSTFTIANASVRITGSFELTQEFATYRSISKQTGKVMLKSGKQYKVRQKTNRYLVITS